jgi:short subunit dehydrogenase-like uncharacterized protein
VVHRLGGRSSERLAAVPSSAERHVVDLEQPRALDGFLENADVLITCVGPFTLYGMPVVDAAVRTGTAYVDSTGEFAFMAQVYERFRNADTAVVPACGFDYIPGDLAAAVAAQELGGVPDDIDVLYRLRNVKPSRGTARTAAHAVSSTRLRASRITMDGPDGPLSAVEVPWGEHVTVPLHVPGPRVRSGIVLPDVASRAAAATAQLGGLVRPLTRLTSPLIRQLADRLPEGPPLDVRNRAEALVVARARSGEESVRVAVHCRDIYGLTARFLVEAALQVKGSGAMATAEALRPRDFLDAVTGEDANGELRWEIL